jgi:hypothetical protein
LTTCPIDLSSRSHDIRLRRALLVGGFGLVCPAELFAIWATTFFRPRQQQIRARSGAFFRTKLVALVMTVFSSPISDIRALHHPS